MKLMLMAASLRQGSFNRQLIGEAQRLLEKKSLEIDLAEFSEFNLPLYNADLDTPDTRPKELHDFIARLKASDGLVLCSPEYNYSIPGTLKNLIDWVSRIKPMPWKDSRIMLMSASPSLVGGMRGLSQLIVPLIGCGAYLYPTMFSLNQAHDAFDNHGHLKDEERIKRLDQNLSGFIDFVSKLNN